MVIHDGYKVGEYWERITNYQQRAICAHCRVTESMDHILTECMCPGQGLIWKLVKELWEKMSLPWIEPHLGIILSCGLTNLKGADRKRKSCESRLYRILVSESAHLIWKLRLERIIGGKPPHSEREITRRWRKCVENRIAIDCMMMSKKYGKRTLTKRLGKGTWTKVVIDADILSEPFIGGTGVLAGRGVG
jgi:hypothetical protein